MACAFTMPRPKSARRADHIPCSRPDVDKLARLALDACVEAGILADDARVAWLLATKVWYPYDLHALDTPGVVIAGCEIVLGSWQSFLEGLMDIAVKKHQDRRAAV
jgi:hypothetical protein